MSDLNRKKANLTIVPTPIGNLGDITVRSMKALESADAIYSEDTRMTQKLINALELDVDAHIYRLDENTMSAHMQDVERLLLEGKSVVYCTDAGMPGVSDPGLRLVSFLRGRGLPVEVLPGASASIVAYVSSSTENPHFFFGGFLPRKESQKRAVLEKLSTLDAALIFYESPNRLVKTLKLIADVFPKRKVSVCRELTKLHEEVVTDNSQNVANLFGEREAKSQIKGECAIVIDGPQDGEEAVDLARMQDEASCLASQLLADGVRPKDAVRKISEQFEIGKNMAYEIVLQKKGELDDR